ncbi:MAG: hypothetical protein KGV44_02625 [Flavobacteriaceae bacterium]|nr:hypothetical protein [Flavobacteriaceae bacterium]
MKKLITIYSAFLMCLSVVNSSFAQSDKDVFEYHSSPEFTNSIFYKKCNSKTYTSAAIWNLSLNYQDKSYDFSTDKEFSAKFRIIKEQENIYDCSTKSYNVNNQQFSMIYTIRNYADCIEILFKKKKFRLNAIDGGEDVHLKNLHHEYRLEDAYEIFTLSVTRDMYLYSTDRLDCLTLKKGSQFVMKTKQE